MCWICQASANGPLSFSNFADDAPWRSTVRTHESYIAELRAAGKNIPALFEAAAGVRLECVSIDILHCVDQGLALYIMGNIFDAVTSRRLLRAGGRDANIAALDRELQAWYKRTKETSKIKGKLTKERIRSSAEWPKLKCKAAAARHAAPFCLELARQYLSRRVVAIVQLLCEFYTIIDSQGLFLDEAAKDRLPKLGRALCGLYAQEATAALVAGERKFKLTPKVHFLLHLCELAPVVGNPRYYWTYSDEDLVGSMIEVASSCHWSTMAPTAMVKWLVMAFD